MNTLLKKLSGWLGRNQTPANQNSLPNSRMPQQSVLHDGSESATRGQLVQVLLRDLLRRSGVPAGWVQCQIQVMNSRSRGQGIYVRLVVKHWDERLMRYAFAFQKTLLTDIVQFEPKATGWLHGISWQLEVATTCPLTELPGPEFWQTPAARAEPVDPFDIVPLPAHLAPAPVSEPIPVAVAAPVSVLVPAASLAAAPLVVPTLPDMPVAAAMAVMPMLDGLEPLPSLIDVPAPPVDDTAQDLERLFAIRDNELASLAKDNLLPVGYESTEPLPLQPR